MTASASRTFAATVAAIEQLTPHFVRVTFTSADLADIGTGGPDQRIKVIFPLPGSRCSALPAGEDWYQQWRVLPDEARNPMRTYTIRRADRAARQLVVDFVAHGDSGPASRWIASARIGDELLVVAPDASSGLPAGGFEWHPGDATTVLVAGDETAVPAICGIIESLAADAVGAVFLEVPSAADILPVSTPLGVRVTWLPRDATAPAAVGTLLDAAVREWSTGWVARGAETRLPSPGGTSLPDTLPDPVGDVLWEVPPDPDGPGLYAWLAGEAGTITGLRRHLVRDLGIDRSRVAFMGYWKNGRAEN